MSIKRTEGHLNPTKCLSAINPRSLSNYDLDSMVTELLLTDGEVEVPIAVLRLAPNDVIWAEIGLDNTDEEWRIANRDLLLRGHRRCAGSCKIMGSPETYTKQIIDNVRRIPATIYEGMTMQQAHDFTIDDKGKVALKKSEIVKMVFNRLHAGLTYQEISMKMPQLLAEFIRNGGVKLQALMRIHDGKKRLGKIDKLLKNVTDSWFRSAFILGPAVEKQTESWIKEKYDDSSMPESEKSLMDCSQTDLNGIRSIRFQTVKENDKSEDPAKAALCFPVTVIERGVDSSDITVIGGNGEVNAAIKKAVLAKYDPSTKDKKVKLPNEKERKATLLALSKTGKAFAAFMNGDDCDNVMEADEENFRMEQRQQWRCGVLEACQADNIHIDGILKKFLLAETTCKVQVEYEEILLELITALQPVKPKSKKQQTAKV